ncbi:copper homeostasis protein CutC [Gramella sp. GC03-9]|uniref:PF03932 family protein CutC n=1 Tax=Christiangramia oceanisediminis TaxID=2920386 RepID=A0A9X2KV11_9FLAO|nr:copper homeostasis protein CutC [Gramella oceanisediminis]MCP9198717.1 copper homeostasis protein CutC [Gramella oceanisediminis]
MLIEVCANSLESALNAEKGGADRIELCSELGVGGITPSFGLIRSVLERISIPVHVLIRPRSGNFTYSEMEFEVMLSDIEICKEMGVSGIVSGALNDKREIDLEKTSKLVQASEGIHFTFHRAFDWLKDPVRSLGQLEDLGVQSILTSGGKSNVDEGFENLIKLKEAAKRCTIMPGSGVNLENIAQFKNSGFQAVHFSASKIIDEVAYEIPVPMNSEKFLQEHIKTISDDKLIKEMIKKIR